MISDIIAKKDKYTDSKNILPVGSKQLRAPDHPYFVWRKLYGYGRPVRFPFL